MPHISELKQSNFLTKNDCGKGILVTIQDCHEENVALPGSPPEMKWCLKFKEQDKPMVLNSTNAQIIAAITGSENTDDWTGSQIVLYNDPNISFQGKLIGGIRARAMRKQATPAPAPAQPQAGFRTKPQNQTPPPEPQPPMEAEPPASDDVPF